MLSLSRATSRLLLAAASTAALAFALTLSPTGVSVAEGCSGSSPGNVCKPLSSATLVTGAAPVPREGILLRLSSPNTVCTWDVAAVAKAADGSTVTGTLTTARGPASSSTQTFTWVSLWKADTILDPSTTYTLEVSSAPNTGAAGSGGGGMKTLAASLPFTTVSESASLGLPTVTASAVSTPQVLERICCSQDYCTAQSTCVDAYVSNVPELTAKVAVGATAAMAPYMSYEVTAHHTFQGQDLASYVATLDGWDVVGTASAGTTNIGYGDYCVAVKTTSLLTGETATSQGCTTITEVDPAPIVRCAETADLIAKCPTLYPGSPTKITGNPQILGSPETFLKMYCPGGAGGASGAGGAAGGPGGVSAGGSSGTAGAGAGGSGGGASAGNAGASGAGGSAGGGELGGASGVAGKSAAGATGGGAGGAAAGNSATAPAVQSADDGGCSVATGTRTGAAAGWLFLLVGLTASRRRRVFTRSAS